MSRSGPHKRTIRTGTSVDEVRPATAISQGQRIAAGHGLRDLASGAPPRRGEQERHRTDHAGGDQHTDEHQQADHAVGDERLRRDEQQQEGAKVRHDHADEQHDPDDRAECDAE